MLRSDPRALLVLIACLSVGLAGCSLGGGSSKAGGPAPTPSPSGRTVTIKFASGNPAIGQAEFLKQLARASGGRLRAVPVRYETDAPGVDQVIARDLVDGRIDVADIAARAWEIGRCDRSACVPVAVPADQRRAARPRDRRPRA